MDEIRLFERDAGVACALNVLRFDAATTDVGCEVGHQATNGALNKGDG